MEILGGVLLILALPVMAIAGFVMALGARGRLALIERRLADIETRLAAGGAVPVAPTQTQAAPVPGVMPQVATPPETIAEFVTKWREGYEVVYGIRRQREQGRGMRWTRQLYYRVVSRCSFINLPVDVGEAMARSGGLGGEASSPTIGSWMSFIWSPTAGRSRSNGAPTITSS